MPWSPHPPRPGPRVARARAGTARPRRTRMTSTTSPWTPILTTRRSGCCSASTAPPSQCSAWERTASDARPARPAWPVVCASEGPACSPLPLPTLLRGRGQSVNLRGCGGGGRGRGRGRGKGDGKRRPAWLAREEGARREPQMASRVLAPSLPSCTSGSPGLVLPVLQIPKYTGS